jgi:hypothetical protein
MNKKLLTTSALTALLAVAGVSTKLYAQSKNFEGAYATVGAGAMESEYESTLNSPATTPADAAKTSAAVVTSTFIGFNNAATTILSRAAQSLTSKETEYVATASLGYNLALDDKFLIGFDLSGRTGAGTKTVTPSAYTITTVAAGTGTDAGAASSVISSTTGTSSLKVKDKAAYAFSIKPTYVVNKDLAVYAKLGYGITSLEATYTTQDTVSSHSINEDVEGHTLGLGATYMIDKTTFVDFGVDYTKNKDLKMSKNDSSVTPTLLSHTLNTTTHTLSETIDSSSIGAFIRVGMKF